MAKINVSLLSINSGADPQQFQVEVVGDNDSKTTHQVTLRKDLYVRLTGGLKSPEELIQVSLEFLLDREPKENIYPTFDLSEIQKYFPEFEQVISAQLAKST